MLRRLFALSIVSVIAGILAGGCSKPTTRGASDAPSTTAAKYLYVSTGVCYSGNGNTTFTATSASNLVYRIDPTTGQRNAVIADYYASPSNPNDTPVGLANLDNDHILVLVENATAGLRRMEKLQKTDYATRLTYNQNSTALSGVLRRIQAAPGGWFLVSKSTDVEKVRDGTNRITQGANAFIRLANPPATSNCATATTLIPDMAILGSNGLIAVAHAAAGKTGFAVISATGYAVAGDCKNNVFQAAPSASTYPTALAFDDINNKLLVAYAGNTTNADINSIYAYSLDPSTGAISSPQKIYDANQFGSTYSYLLYGISSMALDAQSGVLYVATSTSTATTTPGFRIEKLTYTPSLIGVANSGVLVRSGTLYDYGSDTKCISHMVLAN